MQSMNYIGRFISNFKDFYNDINGATLTGAIDVIVVEQPDGTYTCSPFHVRFGKLGVLRSREKVVDIEINGEPQDIHMKLGESGEAFFVEEVQDSDEEDIPDHLATSPIPDSNLDEIYNSQGLARRNSFSLETSIPIFENQINDYSQRRNTDPNDNSNFTAKKREFISRQIELGNIELSEHSNEEMTLSIHSKLSSDDISKDADNSEAIFRMDSLEIEPTPKPSGSVVPKDEIEGPAKPEKEEQEKVENETKSAKKRRRKKSVMKKKNSQRKTATPIEHSVSEISLSQTEESSDNLKANDSATERSSLASNSSEAELCDNMECSTASARKVQRDPDFHFFSDTELTSGPNDSRPHTPIHMESVQSDTEFEVKSRKVDEDDDSQTHSWAWGQFPVTQTPSDVGKNNEQTPEGQAQRNSMLTTVFSFMKQNKNNRMLHSPADGVYLADLNTIEPEVAALYLTNAHRHKHGNDADMDCESGNGPSLPQSPNSIEGAKSIDSDFDENTKANCPQLDDHDISLSLCGWEKEPNEDTFLRQVVNFSDLCNNPSLLESHSLVVRIRDKYFTWKAASPIIASLMIYQRSLPQSTVDQLCSLHMPTAVNIIDKTNLNSSINKQEPTRYSWWGWRRSKGTSRETTPTLESSAAADQQLQASDENNIVLTIEDGPNSQDSMIVANVDQMKTSSIPHDDSFQTGYQSSADSDQGKEKTITDPIKSTSEKCRKTLRLSSEQIAKLNLKEDMNEVEFSVTTAYQGTSRCKCHIYKWRYDDKIVISDIDGTITKSDVLGHILPIVGKDWAQSGVAQLFTKIKDNRYKLLYLSARAIGQARITREYLRSIRQGDLSMPDGPLLLNPTSLISAFHREVIERKPEQFKISCMSDIQALFPSESNPFYAGYGNKINDVWAYRAVGIPIVRIFTINPKGELKHELTQTFQSSYSNMSYIVDQLFPTLIEPAGDYSQFVYWREPIPTVEDLPSLVN